MKSCITSSAIWYQLWLDISTLLRCFPPFLLNWLQILLISAIDLISSRKITNRTKQKGQKNYLKKCSNYLKNSLINWLELSISSTVSQPTLKLSANLRSSRHSSQQHSWSRSKNLSNKIPAETQKHNKKFLKCVNRLRTSRFPKKPSNKPKV